MTALAAEPSAIEAWIAQQRRRNCSDLVRGVLVLVQQTALDEVRAAKCLWACGVGVLVQEIAWAVEWLDVLDNPRGVAETQADAVGFDGPLDEAVERIRDTAQGDLDALVERLVLQACGVSAEVAVLAVVNVLVAS